MVYEIFENKGMWTAVMMNYWRQVSYFATGATPEEAFMKLRAMEEVEEKELARAN